MRKATYIVKPSEITPVSPETAHRAIEVHKYFWTEKHIAKLKKSYGVRPAQISS